jgi:hypothetical protein
MIDKVYKTLFLSGCTVLSKSTVLLDRRFCMISNVPVNNYFVQLRVMGTQQITAKTYHELNPTLRLEKENKTCVLIS